LRGGDKIARDLQELIDERGDLAKSLLILRLIAQLDCGLQMACGGARTLAHPRHGAVHLARGNGEPDLTQLKLPLTQFVDRMEHLNGAELLPLRGGTSAHD